MIVERPESVAAYATAVKPFLLGDEARHNLMLGVTSTLERLPNLYPEAYFWLVRDEAGELVGAAQHTPPFNIAIARPARDGVLEALATGAPDVPGVVAAVPEVDEFTERWCAMHGGRPRVEVEQGVFALEAVTELPRAGGSMRRADDGDRELLRRWMREFSDEAISHEGHGDEELDRMIEQRLKDEFGGFFIWSDKGEPVSFAGAGSRTPNGVRVGPVYTPPELRGRGYATSLVAELSQLLLDRGRRFCFLYTNLANPTANAIYERIGYVRVCTSRQVRFLRRASSGEASSVEPSGARGDA
jgi:GNAT superfamily N-acetyltransferase